MIIALIGIIVVFSILNMVYYEYRVFKGMFKEPKYITNQYAELELKRSKKYLI